VTDKPIAADRPMRQLVTPFCINIVIDYNLYSQSYIFYCLYSILFTICEVAFDNFFIKEFYDDDDDGQVSA